MSLTRASNSRCLGVWNPGMNSSLDTDCTGMGDGNNDSALVSLASSSGDNIPMAILLRLRFTSRQRAIHTFVAAAGRAAGLRPATYRLARLPSTAPRLAAKRLDLV